MRSAARWPQCGQVMTLSAIMAASIARPGGGFVRVPADDASDALLGRLVGEARRLLAGLVGKLGLGEGVELGILGVPAALEGQPHGDAAAMLLLVLLDRRLQGF